MIFIKTISTDYGSSWVGSIFLCLFCDMIIFDYALTRALYFLFALKIKSSEIIFYMMSIRGFFLQLDEVVI